MSGLTGVFNLDGAPVDRDLLERMTRFLDFRGPEARETWICGSVGFGHTMLRTTEESEGERQPVSLDGRLWIVADARVDGRAELLHALAASGRSGLAPASDPELILHAYDVWGEECLERLMGDFAFAIWDAPRRRLFCARDHFGVKPFFYAHVGGAFVFSNTLNCVRLHPAVTSELNELAIADFLLFERNQEPDTSVFRDICRLPAAHRLACDDRGPRVSRYWSLPLVDKIQKLPRGEYVDRFLDLFRTAVKDRLRARRVGVFMSGGLDSTGVAAMAKAILSGGGAPFQIDAQTTVFDELIPDQERYYSGVAAEKIGIPIHYHVADGYRIDQGWSEPELRTPEPSSMPFYALGADFYRKAVSTANVFLTGYGGDPLFYPSTSYVRELLAGLRILTLMQGMSQVMLLQRRLPRIGLRSITLKALGRGLDWKPTYPSWIDPDFAARLDLRSRWEAQNAERGRIPTLRPEAYERLTSLHWAHSFEWQDPGVTRCALEVRHPFFDLRLVNYMMGIPPLPWSVDKQIMRSAMKGILPEIVRLRPKAPLAGDPILSCFKRSGADFTFQTELRVRRYVRGTVDLSSDGAATGENLWTNFRPHSLNLWLQSYQN